MKTILTILFILFTICGFSQNSIIVSSANTERSAFVGSPSFSIPQAGQTIVVFGDSYSAASGATISAWGYAQRLATYYNCSLTNLGIAGSTLEKRSPTDYQGAVNAIDRLSTIPAYSFNYGLLLVAFGLNDLGQTGTNYNVTNYKTDYDSVMHYITATKGWPTSKILIVSPFWIGTAGYAVYASITSNAAPTYSRHFDFIRATKEIAVKWRTNYYDIYKDQKEHDTTLINASDHIHPTDAGYAFIANQLLHHLGANNTDLTIQTLVDQSTVSWDLRFGKRAILSLAGNRSLLISNAFAGDKVTLEILQDGTANRTLAAPSSSYSNTGTFTPNPLPFGRSVFEGFYDGTRWIWTLENLTQVGAAGDPTASFIAQLTALGYTPGGTEATGYQVFHDSCVAQGIWTKMKVAYFFPGTSAATQSLNYITPTTSFTDYYITWNGTISSRTINGWKGNGTNGYGNTNYLATNLTFTDAAFTVWGTDGSVTGNQAVGAYGTNTVDPYFGMNYNYDGTHTAVAIGGNDVLVNINNPTVTQCFTVSRTANNQFAMYANGTSVGTNATITSQIMPAYNMYIGAINGIGTATIFSAQQYCFFVISSGLTSTQATALYGDLNRLKTAMGR